MKVIAFANKIFHGFYQFRCLLRRHKTWIENILFGQISACSIVFISDLCSYNQVFWKFLIVYESVPHKLFFFCYHKIAVRNITNTCKAHWEMKVPYGVGERNVTIPERKIYDREIKTMYILCVIECLIFTLLRFSISCHFLEHISVQSIHLSQIILNCLVFLRFTRWEPCGCSPLYL